MSSPSDIYYDSLPQNITPDQLISMSRFAEYLYDKKNIKTHNIIDLGITVKYISKVSREIANACFVEKFKITNDDKYYDLTTFNEQFKIGDDVTLNYVDLKYNEYYIRGNISEINAINGTITIDNNNPLFFERYYLFDHYSMRFHKHGVFEIKRVKMSMIKKE